MKIIVFCPLKSLRKILCLLLNELKNKKRITIDKISMIIDHLITFLHYVFSFYHVRFIGK